MTLVRVTVAGTIGKAVRINTDATVGSKVGVDFRLPDNTIPTLEELADALYVASPPGEFVSDTDSSAGDQIFESQIIDGLLLARVADNETITGQYMFAANLSMNNGIPINWKDGGGTKFEFLNFSAGSGGSTAVGHIISKITAGVTTTSGTFVAVTGAKVAFSAMDPNTDYAVFVRAYIGNSTSTTTPLNGCVLTKNAIGVPGSEEVYESAAAVIDSHGHLYSWGGIVNSGSSGDLQLEHKSGNGTDTVFANNVVILMIKVSDLGTNIVSDVNTSLVELDDGAFPPGYFDTLASVVIGDGVSDYLVFGSVRVDNFLTGGNKVETRVNDGTNIQEGMDGPLGDGSDEHTLGFWQLWQAPAASTTLTVEARGQGFPVDKVYSSIIAIRMNAFIDYQVAFLATTPDLGNGPIEMVKKAFTVSGAGTYGFLAGAYGPDSSTIGSAQFIRNAVNGGADSTIAGSETQLVTSNIVIGSNSGPQVSISADQVFSASDALDADYVATDAGTTLIWTDVFLTIFQWSVAAADTYKVGNDAFDTEIRGTNVNVSAPLTAISYGGILEANLVDKTADESITGSYTFANNVTKIEGSAVRFIMSETGVGANEGKWRFLANTEQFEFGTLDDAEVGSNSIMLVTRTGIVVDAISFFAPVTATSYSGILAANLLDRTVNEIVTGRWDFESDGSAPQLCIVDSDSNGAATRAFIEFLGKGDVLTGRMGYLSAASGIFTIDNALPNAGVELKSAGVQKLRVDIDGTTVTGTIFVDNTSGEKIVLRDTNSIGNAVLNFIAFKDMNDLRQGVIGFGSSSNDDLLIATDVGFGDVLLNPQGATALRASNTAVAISVPLTATSYDGILAANLLDKNATETITQTWQHQRIQFTVVGKRDIFTEETATGTDKVRIQAGGGSSGFGGTLAVFAHAHATHPGSVEAGISAASGGFFQVRNTGWVSGGSIVFSIDASGDVLANRYDGILAANLLDKSATEDITGSYTFSVGPTFFSAGTEGAPGTAFVGDSDTGVYSPGANIYAITVGGTEAVRYTGASAPLIRTGINSGVTASTTQTQAGATPLTASWNEVAVVANNNDAVVLPSMVKGETCVVINSSAKKLQVFPALGKDVGAGIDAPVAVKANSSRYWFHYDDVVGFDIATEFKSLQGIEIGGATDNDLLYRSGGDWKHTNGDLTWDGVTLKAVILKPVKYVQHRTASTANLNDITHAVNTDPGKVEGAQVFNTNLNTPVWAKGSADGDKWVNGIGIEIHSPV